MLALGLAALPGTAQRHNQEIPPTYPGGASMDGVELSVPVARTAAGPLVGVEPIVERLGGELSADASGEDEGYELDLDGTQIIFGSGSPSILRDSEILRLSQPPVWIETVGLLVPVDFFERTYGDLLGFRFSWDEAADRLVVRRPERREMPVQLDVVHLQGVSTLVLEFPERPRYHLVESPGIVDVELAGITLPASSRGRRRLDDPLVEAVEMAAGSIRVVLAPGAETESYTLEKPFRIVFDVHRRRGAARPPGVAELAPPTPREGLHTIVLDPGHGGAETGAIGPSGVAEKDITLLLARTLRSRLMSRMPVRVVLTRDEDVDLPLATRTSIANQNKADLFLSIHLNSAAGVVARGAETYFLSLQASDERAAEAAEIENQAAAAEPEEGLEAVGGSDGDPLYDLQLILWDLAQSHNLAESQSLARLIQEELNGALDLRDRGVKQAPFRVLMGAAMPSVLVELGFLNNPEEERRFQDPAYRAQLVDALVRAIARYRALVESRNAPEVSGAPSGDAAGSRAAGTAAEGGPAEERR
jgi:N-acetylmuramoyl-L-alanine amidase